MTVAEARQWLKNIGEGEQAEMASPAELREMLEASHPDFATSHD